MVPRCSSRARTQNTHTHTHTHTYKHSLRNILVWCWNANTHSTCTMLKKNETHQPCQSKQEQQIGSKLACSFISSSSTASRHPSPSWEVARVSTALAGKKKHKCKHTYIQKHPALLHGSEMQLTHTYTHLRIHTLTHSLTHTSTYKNSRNILVWCWNVSTHLQVWSALYPGAAQHDDVLTYDAHVLTYEAVSDIASSHWCLSLSRLLCHSNSLLLWHKNDLKIDAIRGRKNQRFSEWLAPAQGAH